MYAPPRLRDGSFFCFFLGPGGGGGGGGKGAMERPLFENGIYVTLNVEKRGL